jgi:hypothetical protein
MSQKIKIDDKDYDISDISDRGKNLIIQLQNIDSGLKEIQNMIAILTKAKRAYMADLKSEMLSKKAGFDFSE